MDHNLDLLHSDIHTPTHKFLNMLLDMQLFSTITHPSRITQTSATLIDNNPTRNKALPNMQQHSGKLFHMSFMCKNLSAYGNLPLQLQREQKMGLFVKKTKKLFLLYY